MTPARWRVLLTEPADGAWNMAVDEVLLRHAHARGECVLRVYGWQVPTLSFGRNQRAVGQYDRERLLNAGIDCVRRPTGGRAVLHFREVTYAVAAPAALLGTLRESYDRIGRLLLHALRILGVGTASVAVRHNFAEGDGSALGPAPCFDRPVGGEILVDGRKTVGSAQWRDGDAILQHGSILTGDDQSRIAGLMISGETRPNAAPPGTLGAALGREPDWREVAAALTDAVVDLEDPGASPLHSSELPASDIEATCAKYRDDEWTWRR